MATSQFQKLREDEMRIGSPLPWNVFDSGGQLLLCKGYIIGSTRQQETLIKLGLFREQTADEKKEEPVRASPKLSPFDIITQFQYRLKALITEIHKPSGPNIQDQITRFAKDVQALCAQDLDAGLGALHIDHEGQYIHIHPIHTALLTELITKRLNIPEHDRVSMIAAALTANIGMVELQATLHNQKAPLSPHQQEEIWGHPERGVALLKKVGVTDALWLDTILHHHERLNGKGYPSGLSGEQITVGVRVISLADTYSAMVTPRAYRAELQAKEALKEIFLKRGSDIDESLAHVFIKELGIYPPGAFVRLVNGEVAVVIKRGSNATNPVVQSIISPRGGPYSIPRQHNCEQDMFKIKEVVPREKNLPVSLRKLWGYD